MVCHSAASTLWSRRASRASSEVRYKRGDTLSKDRLILRQWLNAEPSPRLSWDCIAKVERVLGSHRRLIFVRDAISNAVEDGVGSSERWLYGPKRSSSPTGERLSHHRAKHPRPCPAHRRAARRFPHHH